METKAFLMETDKFKECIKKGFRLIDVRPPVEFANGFIPGALNIPFTDPENFIEMFRKFIGKDRSFLLVDDETIDNNTFEFLLKNGFDNIKGVLNGGMLTWENSGMRLDMVIAPDMEEFILDLKHDDEIRLVDIRTAKEFDNSHIEKAENVPLAKILKDVNLMLDGKIYYLYCRDGMDSMTIISYLKLHNKHNFYYLEGGFDFLKEQDGISVLTSL